MFTIVALMPSLVEFVYDEYNLAVMYGLWKNFHIKT